MPRSAMTRCWPAYPTRKVQQVFAAWQKAAERGPVATPACGETECVAILASLFSGLLPPPPRSEGVPRILAFALPTWGRVFEWHTARKRLRLCGYSFPSTAWIFSWTVSAFWCFTMSAKLSDADPHRKCCGLIHDKWPLPHKWRTCIPLCFGAPNERSAMYLAAVIDLPQNETDLGRPAIAPGTNTQSTPMCDRCSSTKFFTVGPVLASA